MRLLASFMLCIMLTVIGPAGVAAEVSGFPAVTADSAALVDVTTGKLLGGHNLDKRIYPASTTKVLTGLIAVETGNLDDMVLISRRAQDQEGTSLYSRVGEKYAFRDLLYAMMVQSCNDAAVAVAEHLAGTVEEFSDMMNSRAAELGATNSHFVNPNGLHDPDHYTTAADMARIFSAAMKSDILREIMTTRVYRVTIGTGEERILVNGNDMLVTYPGTSGGKTGYTKEAQQTILTAAQRGSLQLGVAVFGAQGKGVWSDAKSFLDYGFKHWQYVDVVGAGQTVTAMPVTYGEEVLLVADSSVSVLVPVERSDLPVHYAIELDRRLKAPLKAGAEVGKVTYWLGEQQLGVSTLKVAHTVPRPWYTFWELPFLMFAMVIAWRFRRHIKGAANINRQQGRVKRG